MHFGPSSLGMQYVQQPDVSNQSEDNHLPPTSIEDKSRRGGRSLMGGLINGLRPLPTVGGGQKMKR